MKHHISSAGLPASLTASSLTGSSIDGNIDSSSVAHSVNMDLPLDPLSRQRFFSEEDCRAIGKRLARATSGSGVWSVDIWSHWSGHVRWSRNQLITSGDVRSDYILVHRNVNGASENAFILINEATDEALIAAARRAERLLGGEHEDREWDLPYKRYSREEISKPKMFSDTTYQLDAEHRASSAIALTKMAASKGMLSAGYIEITANCIAKIDSLGNVLYFPYTDASYNVTVRDPEGTASGWAGVDWPDWSRIDTSKLTNIALDKCLNSRNPVAIEPGRYTTILEPQAVMSFVEPFVKERSILHKTCDEGNHLCFALGPLGVRKDDVKKGIIGMSKLGEKLFDERISIWSDLMDPDLAFPPFNPLENYYDGMDVYHPTTWIKNGVLVGLEYSHPYAVKWLGRDAGSPTEGGFRMSGGDTSVDEMITTTKRGILVTRFYDTSLTGSPSLSVTGFTRDGLWLIEDGKISKPIKNMMFNESIFFALNNVEQLGVPQRVFGPSSNRMRLPQPAIVPPLKIKDFSFVALADAI